MKTRFASDRLVSPHHILRRFNSRLQKPFKTTSSFFALRALHYSPITSFCSLHSPSQIFPYIPIRPSNPTSSKPLTQSTFHQLRQFWHLISKTPKNSNSTNSLTSSPASAPRPWTFLVPPHKPQTLATLFRFLPSLTPPTLPLQCQKKAPKPNWAATTSHASHRVTKTKIIIPTRKLVDMAGSSPSPERFSQSLRDYFQHWPVGKIRTAALLQRSSDGYQSSSLTTTTTTIAIAMAMAELCRKERQQLPVLVPAWRVDDEGSFSGTTLAF